MIVFDPQGNEHDKPSVDARECVETLGWSYEKPQAKPVKAKKSDGELLD